MTYEDLAAELRRRRVPTWMQDGEPAALWRLAAEAAARAAAEGREAVALELGTYCGHGAALLAGAGCRVTTVDRFDPGWDAPHGGRCPTERSADYALQLWEELGLSDRVRPVAADVTDPEAPAEAPPAVDLLFVDADHQVASLERQCALWLPLVRPGGVVAFHDWGMRGDEALPWDVAGVARRACAGWEGFGRVATLAWFRRPAPEPAPEPEAEAVEAEPASE